MIWPILAVLFTYAALVVLVADSLIQDAAARDRARGDRS